MCLGVPGRVVAVDGPVAHVDFWGVSRRILLDTVDEPVVPGDYVLTHVGYAIRRIPASEIGETLEFYDSLVREEQADLMSRDVKEELGAAQQS